MSFALNRFLSVFLVLLALVGGVAIWVATDVATRLSAATGTVSQAAEVLDESLVTADSVVASIGDGLRGADLIVADISSSTELTAGVIDQASSLLINDVADSVESIERALPGLIEAGRVIDNTLAALEFFGVAYDSEVPFGEALVDIQASLAGLDDELRTQGEGLGEISEPVRNAGAETAELATVLADVQAALFDAQSQLAEYRASTDDLRQFAESQSVDSGLIVVLGRSLAVLWAATGVLAGVSLWRSETVRITTGIETVRSG